MFRKLFKKGKKVHEIKKYFRTCVREFKKNLESIWEKLQNTDKIL